MATKYSEKKKKYFQKLLGLLGQYSKVLLIEVENVSATQLHNIRKNLRGEGEILMGKNTLIRKVLRAFADKGNPQVEPLIPEVRGNIGLVFSNKPLGPLRIEVESLKQEAPAKQGAIAPIDVIVPAGPTGLEPTQTTFLQALNINTKIVRGQVEILQAHHLITTGTKVTAGQATLLQKLNINPFSYGAKVRVVFDDGFVYPARLLDTTDRDVLGRFAQGLRRIAAVSLQIGIPTVASVPHSLANAYKNLVAIAVETEYSFPGAEPVKEFLADPEAFLAANASAAPADAEAAPAETKEPTPEPSEESGSIGLDMFGGSDSE